MSWLFSSTAPAEGSAATTTGSSASDLLHVPAERAPAAELFGPLVPEDTEWLQGGGFITETQIWYGTTPSGGLVMIQIIHSGVGMWYPQIQFTFRYFDPSANPPIKIWKSVNVTNFVVPAPAGTNKVIKPDRRSCKSDQFSITVDPDQPNTYKIEGTYDKDVQVSLEYTRAAGVPGWKLGAGPQGGMTYFGALKSAKPTGSKLPDTTSGTDGFAVHRFWPRCHVKGIVRTGKEIADLSGSTGMFVHAIQGMRPNLVAARWNFANFQSPASSDPDQSVSLTMMEFTTTSYYGTQKVNIGSVVVGDKLIAVTAGSRDGKAGSSATHLEAVVDQETSYSVPQSIRFDWAGPLIDSPSSVAQAEILLELDPLAQSKGKYEGKGLIEKVDVLAEIPYLVKKVINVVAGTKPYIYQWLNPVTAKITIPSTTETGSTRELTVDGVLFNEATWIS
ncbi:uncharacterized protein L969DRAFT_16391 [Mixia osmundae IAM 14324]|uniref:Svf1-like C-terminal domain-containing protein n=1 Tax=Mixia osmundae (strain CBS 9802 / IAM 14324 / JCM 22182 / KY 12970) TaxID=764103 RepID=G7DUA6_MIXOS|nr:uncharacterized protein L969DRAFT_16391 [Mixia osmundae IAM 14324]KEI41037.1 hypothetical protein L969DRAFT_16391 [Mixia osmundae IAM 14324]GAA94166.1 hypothetical protein E5Q_00814 [Mixia osmundae IAM 14324]